MRDIRFNSPVIKNLKTDFVLSAIAIYNDANCRKKKFNYIKGTVYLNQVIKVCAYISLASIKYVHYSEKLYFW